MGKITCQQLAIWKIIQYYTHGFSLHCVCKNIPQPCLLSRALLTPALLATLGCLLIYLSLPLERNPSSIRSAGNVPSVPIPSGSQFFPWLTSRILYEHYPLPTWGSGLSGRRSLFAQGPSTRPREKSTPGLISPGSVNPSA